LLSESAPLIDSLAAFPTRISIDVGFGILR
jgi:hypothetical protein